MYSGIDLSGKMVEFAISECKKLPGECECALYEMKINLR